jgi:hypothetical protein
MRIPAAIPGFAPENGREWALATDPEIVAGLAWGHPRPGHPEGAVGRHVAALLAAIEAEEPSLRTDLRFLAIVHDALKRRVCPEAGWSPDNDHAMLARRFAERYTRDPRLLVALELHDEPYWLWRTRGEDGVSALHALLRRVPDAELFLRFVELDAATDGKDPGLLAWVRAAMGGPRAARSARSRPDAQRSRAGGAKRVGLALQVTRPDTELTGSPTCAATAMTSPAPIRPSWGSPFAPSVKPSGGGPARPRRRATRR